MHKSCLGTVVIDCNTDDLDRASSFRASALGWESQRLTDPKDANYRRLDTPANEVNVPIQAVTHPSRAHIDIETNDVEAEVARLEKLGATSRAGKTMVGDGSGDRASVLRRATAEARF